MCSLLLEGPAEYLYFVHSWQLFQFCEFSFSNSTFQLVKIGKVANCLRNVNMRTALIFAFLQYEGMKFTYAQYLQFAAQFAADQLKARERYQIAFWTGKPKKTYIIDAFDEPKGFEVHYGRLANHARDYAHSNSKAARDF